MGFKLQSVQPHTFCNTVQTVLEGSINLFMTDLDVFNLDANSNQKMFSATLKQGLAKGGGGVSSGAEDIG
jgi:hypothetical protein